MSASEMSTFTKWVTTEPKMAGVVGGAGGNGSYSGEILKDTTGPVEAIVSSTNSGRIDSRNSGHFKEDQNGRKCVPFSRVRRVRLSA